MKKLFKKVVSVGLTAALTLSMAITGIASASAATYYYNTYSTVADILNRDGCSAMQGMAVGSTYLYTVKIKEDNSGAVLQKTNKNTGATTNLTNSTGSIYNYLNHANDMDVTTIDGYSQLFVATMATGGNSLVRIKVDGSKATKSGGYNLIYNGQQISVAGVAVEWTDANNVCLLLKSGATVYRATVPKAATSGTINIAKAFTLNTSSVKVNGSYVNLSSYTHQGFGYHDGKIFVPLWGGSAGKSNQSVIAVYDTYDATGKTLTSDPNLSFRITSGAYAGFEIESCDISSDGQLYFNVNRWSSNNGNQDAILRFNGYTYNSSVFAPHSTSTPTPTPAPTPVPNAGIVYSGHVENYGDVAEVSNWQTLGTLGQGLRIEGIKMRVTGMSGDVQYRVHVQNCGWMDWKSANAYAGTVGQGLRIEALQIRLVGDIANYYGVEYQAHVQDYGWLSVASNGGLAGTTGRNLRVEALRIRLVDKSSCSGTVDNNVPAPVQDTTPPTISNVKVTEVSANGYRVTCNVSDNTGVTSVKFPTWTESDGQDDLVWHEGTISGNTATFYVNRNEHKGNFGIYITHIYAYDSYGNQCCNTEASKVRVVDSMADMVFDADFYSNKYTDLKNAYGTDYTKLYAHFINYGIKEGRQAHINFDVRYYLNNNKDLINAFGADNYSAAYNHYLSYGCKEGRVTSTSMVFDAKYYCEKYPDLKNAYGMDVLQLYNHFINHGISEGRQACANFNVKYYLENNQDLLNWLGRENYQSAYNHYIYHGCNENRRTVDTTPPTISNVKVTEVSANGYRITCNVSDDSGVTSVKFPTWTESDGQDDLVWHEGTISGNTATFYVNRNEHKGNFGIYITHIYAYDSYGNQCCNTEASKVRVVDSMADMVFDADFYSNKYTDLKNAYGTDYTKLYAHFINYGIKEGRQAHINFDVRYYLNNNKDLINAFGADNYSAAYNHYLSYGCKEGRKTSATMVFDAAYYSNKYSDLKNAFGMDAVSLYNHFINYGISEGRQACSSFNVVVYLNSNNDLLRTFGGGNFKAAYNHYLSYGFKEGRVTA